jgi:signal transduction histidine kinase/CheY-like chemotaxis protein
MVDQDDIVDIVDDSDDVPVEAGPRWKVLVIDDEPAVHDGTRFALADYSLNGQGLEIVSAYSAEEGRAMLRAHPDTAVVLLDVIMESDTAGLDLVGFIRTELANETIRIILRTGQPGQAPERRIIVDYDINDYKAKTELTADKLFTSLTAALRGYQQLQRMVETRRGLEIIVDAASTLYDFRSIQRLAEGVLVQLASLLNVDCDGILVFHDGGREHPVSVLAAAGCYTRHVGADGVSALDPEMRQVVEDAFRRGTHQFMPRWSVLYIRTGSGREVVVMLHVCRPLSDTDRTLVEIFTSKLSIAFDNVILYEQLQEANSRLEDRVNQRTRELTSANRRLSSQWSRLQRANAFKTEILGTVAHDLRNPLSVIIGRAEILERMVVDPALDPAAAKTQIGHIHKATDRVADMVERLIADAMTDALDITIRRDPADLAGVLAEVAEANQPLAAKKDQVIAVTAEPGPPVTCDVDRIREAVDNLVSNAVKYSAIGGRIEVGLAQRPDGAHIRVKDAGPGMTPEDLKRLYGRFQRLSAKPTGGESSIGLGLSIVKRIVDLHGGTIMAESAGEGLGTTFTLILPLRPAEGETEAPAASGEGRFRT